LAGAIGLAALGTIAENHSKALIAAGHDVVGALASGYQIALLIAATCVVVGLVLSPFLLRTEESPEEQAARIRENMANPEAREHLVL
jgi:hypothetical protein